jgi:hypothetical protein
LQRRVVFRGLAAAGLASAVLAVGLPAASGRPAAERNSCVNPDTSAHWEAVFGHTTSVSQAIPIQRALAVKGFKGIQLEMDSCDDIELEVSGVDSPAQRLALAKEADRVNVPVSFESQDEQKQNRPGEVTAVFGTLPTLKRASTLQGAIAVKGWRESDIVRLSLHSWRVIVAHVPNGVKASFATEARRAGYRVTFESG